MVDPGLLLDLELRHSSVLMLPSPTARRQLAAPAHWTSSSQGCPPARRGSKQLDSAGVHCGHYVFYLLRGSPPVGSSRLVLQTAGRLVFNALAQAGGTASTAPSGAAAPS